MGPDRLPKICLVEQFKYGLAYLLHKLNYQTCFIAWVFPPNIYSQLPPRQRKFSNRVLDISIQGNMELLAKK